MTKQALLISKPLGLKLLDTLDIEDALVLHPDDRTDARSVLPEIEALCRERTAAFQVVASRKESETALADFRPDVAFVCGWYWLLGPETLALTPFYGIHNSLLPKYRGGAPLVWAIIHGEEEVGSTLFQLAGGLDDGLVAHQVRVPLPREASIADATAMIEAKWLDVFPGIWRGLCAGAWPLREQEGEPSQFPNRKPADGEIDWTWPDARIHDFIRAQSHPYPGAFMVIRGQRIIADRSTEDPAGLVVRWRDQPARDCTGAVEWRPSEYGDVAEAETMKTASDLRVLA